jgi:hypothetical protein
LILTGIVKVDNKIFAAPVGFLYKKVFKSRDIVICGLNSIAFQFLKTAQFSVELYLFFRESKFGFGNFLVIWFIRYYGFDVSERTSSESGGRDCSLTGFPTSSIVNSSFCEIPAGGGSVKLVVANSPAIHNSA